MWSKSKIKKFFRNWKRDLLVSGYFLGYIGGIGVFGTLLYADWMVRIQQASIEISNGIFLSGGYFFFIAGFFINVITLPLLFVLSKLSENRWAYLFSLIPIVIFVVTHILGFNYYTYFNEITNELYVKSIDKVRVFDLQESRYVDVRFGRGYRGSCNINSVYFEKYENTNFVHFFRDGGRRFILNWKFNNPGFKVNCINECAVTNRKAICK